MDKVVDQCKNKNLRQSAYFRFCCLLDFFQVDLEDLFYEYLLLYSNNEGACTDDIKKIFKYDMQRYKNNKNALSKFGTALTSIIENRIYSYITNENIIMKKAMENVLQYKIVTIVLEYKSFLSFFETLIIFI